MKKIVIDDKKLNYAKKIGLCLLAIWIIASIVLFFFDLPIFYVWIVGSLGIIFLFIYLLLRVIERR